MISRRNSATRDRNLVPQVRLLGGLLPLVAAFLGGLVLHMLGRVGQGVALMGALYLILQLFNLTLQQKRSSFQPALILGFLVNSQVFIRDFAMRGLPAGYLALEYVIIFLGLASLPSLFFRERILLFSAPVLVLFCVCIWDSLGLLYSEDLWQGRIIICLHWAGLFCLLFGAAAFANEESRRGLLDGIVLGTFLSLGVMLRQTTRASYGVDLDSGFRFGHALVSAVQVGTVLTAGMLASLLKLIRGYGRARDSLLCLALLSPFCIATFSRGPLLAFFAAAICLSLYRRRSKGWWKLPAAGLLLGGAVIVVMWCLPSNFDNRYQELQGADERSRIWRVVLEMWKESPIVGYGPGSWFTVYPRFAAYAERAPDRISDAHNFLVQAAADGGSIGVGLFILLLICIMYHTARARSAIGLALFIFVVLAASLANFKLSVLFLLMGAGLGECFQSSRNLSKMNSMARRPALPPVASANGPGLFPARLPIPGTARRVVRLRP